MLIVTHAGGTVHDTGPDHPECPARLDAVTAALRRPDLAALVWQEAPRADRAQLTTVHTGAHVAAVLAAVPASGHARLDPDTVVGPGSGAAALEAAGGAVAAVDAVIAGPHRQAFCALRPPGHHAEPARAMGFCLFNTVAIAAVHAARAHGCRRVAVVDFDVHHGNGTEAAFRDRPGFLYASIHQHPCYPGTGLPGAGEAVAPETGTPDSAAHRPEGGVIINVPLAPGAGSAAFRAALAGPVLTGLRSFAPDLLLISAGFDAHRDDPLADINLEVADFAWATRQLRSVAAACGGGRIVSVLEGGYHLPALGAAAAAHVAALMEA